MMEALFGVPNTTVRLSYEELRDSDVIMGRIGGKKHPGTQRFRHLISQHNEAYGKCLRSSEREALSETIVKELEGLHPPARFVKKDAGSSLFVTMERRWAVEKTEHALRNCYFNSRKNTTTQQQAEHQRRLLQKKFVRLRPTDILMGRGNTTASHPGNRYFRHLVQQYQKAFADTLVDSPLNVAKAVVDELESRDPPIRFVEEADFKGSNYYLVVAKSRAIRKAAAVLYDVAYKSKARATTIGGDNDVEQTIAATTTAAVTGVRVGSTVRVDKPRVQFHSSPAAASSLVPTVATLPQQQPVLKVCTPLVAQPNDEPVQSCTKPLKSQQLAVSDPSIMAYNSALPGQFDDAEDTNDDDNTTEDWSLKAQKASINIEAYEEEVWYGTLVL